jgi:hypothetical protein
MGIVPERPIFSKHALGEIKSHGADAPPGAFTGTIAVSLEQKP